MIALENRPEVLWRRLDQLWPRYEQGGPLTDLELEALVEASFRLGVHPETGVATALALLARAHRLDPANPKHPYHIGLIYLRHGRLKMAEKWLAAAAALSPTNHRIWAHVSIVQRGLDDLRSGSADYDGDHRRRAEEILTAIREGRDDLDPAARPPLRRPGECRWPGVLDLGVEDQLRGRTAERTRDVLAGELAAIARSASRRRGGTAAFAVLAVQWMVYGYPPATIRRLAGDLADGDGPAARLLNLVCELFEIDETELPARLARCLAEHSLPDLLVAMIHRGRLFRRPLRLPDVGAYTAAKNFTGGDPAGPIAAMTTALRVLSAEPPGPMADTRPTGAAPAPVAGPDEKLARLEHAAAELSGLITRLREFAKELVKASASTPEAAAQVAGDCAVLARVVDRIEAARAARLDELRELKTTEPAGLIMSFDQFRARVEECEPLLQESAGKIKVTLRKAGQKLKKRADFESVEPVPSARAWEIEAAVSAAEGKAITGPQERKPRSAAPTPRTEGTPEERVAATVAAVEGVLADNRRRARRTLGAYDPHLRDRSAVVLLRAFLTGQQAEADQRMGRAKEARRGWNSMLADDPLNAAAMRNLAVAHASAGDLGAATQAWSHYLETLYLQDLLAGDPHRGAAHRAEVHRILAGSFGTAVLVARTTRDADAGDDVRDVPPVLASRAKVTTVTAHLRLEELNRALSYQSPTLLLGVGRSITEAELAMARDRRLASAEAATAALSPRVRVPFTDLCRRAIENAHQAATGASGRIRRPTDEMEEEAHSAWAKERILWKQRLSQATVGKDAEWPLTEYSGDVIGNLQLIDDLPLDPLDEFIRRGVQQLGVQGDPTHFLERHNQLSDLACKFALRQIHDAAGQNTSTFPDQFNRVCRSWARNPIPDTYLDSLDSPRSLYYSSAKSAFEVLADARGDLDEQDRRVVEAAATALERWVARLPGATGPACDLARLLSALDRHEEAARVLSTAEAGAFSARGRREVAISYVRLAIDRAKYREALGRIRELLKEGDAETRLRRLLTQAYNLWISSGMNVPSVGQIKEDLSPWSDDPEAVQERRLLVVSATIVRHRSRPGGTQLEALGAELRELCADDDGNAEARYQLVVVLHRHARQVREQMTGFAGAGRRELQGRLGSIRDECAGHAELLLADGALSSEARRDELTTILKQVRRQRP
jgi:tetratricopeptide (TPR) repeat protein